MVWYFFTFVVCSSSCKAKISASHAHVTVLTLTLHANIIQCPTASHIKRILCLLLSLQTYGISFMNFFKSFCLSWFCYYDYSSGWCHCSFRLLFLVTEYISFTLKIIFCPCFVITWFAREILYFKNYSKALIMLHATIWQRIVLWSLETKGCWLVKKQFSDVYQYTSHFSGYLCVHINTWRFMRLSHTDWPSVFYWSSLQCLNHYSEFWCLWNCLLLWVKTVFMSLDYTLQNNNAVSVKNHIWSYLFYSSIYF